ncbi:MAG: hypothetical protein IJA02_00470 [Clostridia bacterium]|nr:hypothetical protein [Clostridia bacterium]
MANKRQKKKKNSQAAKQAAAAYKGKNAVAKPAAVKKPEQPKPAQATEKKPEPKPQPKPQPVKQQQVEKQQTAKPKKQQKKKPVKKQKTFKEIKFQIKKKFASVDPKKGSAVILAVSIVIAVICVGALILSLRFTVPSEAKVKYMGVNVDDSEALVVTDDLATQYEFTDRMKRKGDTDEFRYYAETEITFVEKYLPAKLNLVNVFDNECVLIASIVDEAGNVVYQSLGLPAGRRLADITINSLPYGTHETKLVVVAYDPESYKLIGVQYSDLTVQVGIEEEETDEKTQER